MTHDNEAGNEVTDREIIMSRLLNAPRELVWKVWTQPEHLINWWGPNGFTTTSKNMSLTAGGEWRFVMHGPDGRDYQNRIVFTEVKKPELLRYKHAGDEETEPISFEVKISFAAEGRKTRLKMVMTFANAAELSRVEKEYGAIEGGIQHVASLEEYLYKIKTTEPFVIERLLNAPVALVWKAISNKEEMKKWYFDLAEFKPEVGFEFSFTGGSEEKSYLHLCKVTVAEEEKKLAYTWRYDEYEGNSEVTFELFAEGDKTRLVLTHTGLETFPKNNKDFARESFEEGWTFIIGKSLPEYLEKQ